MAIILSLKEAKARARKKSAIIIGKYNNASTKVLLRCINCSHEWKQAIAQISISKVGCKVCASRINATRRRKPVKAIKQQLAQLGIRYLGGYVQSHSPIRVKFLKCGHISNRQTFGLLRRGYGCSICYHVQPTDYKKLARQFGGKLISAAASSREISVWQCPNGCVFKRSYQSIKSGESFCLNCSKGLSERICRVAFEQIFRTKFSKLKIKSLKGVKGGTLEFDLYAEINNQKIAVEHQGSHHYRPRFYKDYSSNQASEIFLRQQANDKLKKRYAKINSIFLFEIPELFSQTALKDLKQVIAAEGSRLKCAMPQDFSNITLDFAPAFQTNNTIIQLQDFKKALRGSSCRLLESEYKGYKEKHLVQCANGHEYYTSPFSLLVMDSGCPKCYRNSFIRVLCSNGKLYESANAAGRDLNVTGGTIHSALRKQHYAGKFLFKALSWQQYNDLKTDSFKVKAAVRDLLSAALNKRRHTMPFLTSNGNLYTSQTEGAKAFKCKQSLVCAALKRKNATLKGVGVIRLCEEQYEELKLSPKKLSNFVAQTWTSPPKKMQSKQKIVIGSDKSEYESVSACAKYIGVSVSYVSTAIKRKSPIQSVIYQFKI